MLNSQVNLEYLGRVVFNTEGLLYPDSVVGTDSHTTMIDGLGVAGWGVGGIEAEAAMLGQVIKFCCSFILNFNIHPVGLWLTFISAKGRFLLHYTSNAFLFVIDSP